MIGARILAVDDSADTLELLRRQLARAGHVVSCVGSVAEAEAALRQAAFDVVITDLKMPGASGLDLIRHVREFYRDVEVLMVTGYPSVETAVQALREGAEDYLPKPFTAEELVSAVERALTKLRARKGVRVGTDSAEPDLGLVGTSAAFREVVSAVRTAAPLHAPLLVEGPPGAGRRTIARALHAAGPHASAPFVRYDAAGAAPHEAARELFGPQGLAVAAGRGTLYVTDVAELPDGAQEELETRLGAADATGPRLVLSTARDLHAAAERGTFRRGLAARLTSLRVRLPALAERADDIPLLAGHFAERAVRGSGRGALRFEDRALAALLAHPWPGNVAELAAVVEDAALRASGGLIELADLPHWLRSGGGAVRTDRSLAEVESAYIRDVLRAVGDNRTRAAEVLGIDRKTLREKLRRDEP